MKEKTIVKYVEPLLHIFPLVFGLAVGISNITQQGGYVATEVDAWCSLPPGNPLRRRRALLLSAVFLAPILICIVLIVWRVVKTEKQLNNSKLKRRSSLATMEKATRSLQNTKVVLIQTSAYLISYLLSTAFLLYAGVIEDDPEWLIYTSMAMVPSQGFFNALIFFSHKVYNYRRVYSDVSRCDVIKLLFLGGSQEPILFTRISLIQCHENRRIMDIEFADEGGNELLRIEEEDIISASRSGGDVLIGDGSQRDDDLSGFQFSEVSKSNDSENLYDGNKLMSLHDTCTKGLSGSSSTFTPTQNIISSGDSQSLFRGQVDDSLNLITEDRNSIDDDNIDSQSRVSQLMSMSQENTASSSYNV